VEGAGHRTSGGVLAGLRNYQQALLYWRVKGLCEKEGGARSEPIVNLTWNYGDKGVDGEIECIDVHRVAQEVNGYYVDNVYDRSTDPPRPVGKKGELVPDFTHLRTDGTTACGNWLYSRSYTQVNGRVINMMARREKADPKGWASFPIGPGPGL